MNDETLQQLMKMQQEIMRSSSGFLASSPSLKTGSPPVAAPVPAIERAEMRVVDLIGYRCWKVHPAGYLRSVSVARLWMPGEVMTGEVGDHDGKGVHAFVSQEDSLLYNQGGTEPTFFGRVKLWGEVVEHERGYRAQYARIVGIDACSGEGPFCCGQAAEALAFLRLRYGVEK